MVEIDGSQGEGGGQMLRTSLALSLITGKAFHLKNVRARRDRPGLQPQHLMGVTSAATIGNAHVKGASLGSTDLVFEPGKVEPGTYHFNIGTAGATSLVLHTLYMPLALAGSPSQVTVVGGTHVRACPCYHFLDLTWRPYLELLGIPITLAMSRPGFYPRGGGMLEAQIPSAQPRSLQLDEMDWRGGIDLISAVAGLPEHIRERQAEQASKRLSGYGYHVSVREETWPGGPGTFLGVLLRTSPAPTLFFGLGERGKTAERVADEAVDQAETYLCSEPYGVDAHSADQILLPLALAAGASRYRTAEVTSHLLTNAQVIRKFVERDIEVRGKEGKAGTVEIV